MNLSRLRSPMGLETISNEEIADLRARESEENFDFEDIKKFLKFNQKLAK